MATSTRGSATDQVIRAAPEPLKEIVAELTSAALKRHPDAHVIAWPRQRIISFGFGPRKMSEHYFYIGVQSRHVNAGFYHGASLPDPRALLEGTGTRLRHVKVRTVEEARRPALLALLVSAKAERARR